MCRRSFFRISVSRKLPPSVKLVKSCIRLVVAINSGRRCLNIDGMSQQPRNQIRQIRKKRSLILRPTNEPTGIRMIYGSPTGMLYILPKDLVQDAVVFDPCNEHHDKPFGVAKCNVQLVEIIILSTLRIKTTAAMKQTMSRHKRPLKSQRNELFDCVRDSLHTVWNYPIYASRIPSPKPNGPSEPRPPFIGTWTRRSIGRRVPRIS
mmetsp:Transcript_11674/g.23730  ORF Transcript_11674/g.23730 Transcript_11674/m.23730 type:complete len:206 (+) Transcript_11674:376-993(+)